LVRFILATAGRGESFVQNDQYGLTVFFHLALAHPVYLQKAFLGSVQAEYLDKKFFAVMHFCHMKQNQVKCLKL
jgi:hypothetical protein